MSGCRSSMTGWPPTMKEAPVSSRRARTHARSPIESSDQATVKPRVKANGWGTAPFPPGTRLNACSLAYVQCTERISSLKEEGS